MLVASRFKGRNSPAALTAMVAVVARQGGTAGVSNAFISNNREKRIFSE
jgi:hypothetical protein